MIRFLEHLTRRNWGFPYHILLCVLGTQAISILAQDQLAGFLIINIAGVLYEVWQNRSSNNPDFQGSLEDIAGNLIGSGAGLGILNL